MFSNYGNLKKSLFTTFQRLTKFTKINNNKIAFWCLVMRLRVYMSSVSHFEEL